MAWLHCAGGLLATSQTFAGQARPGFVATCDNGHSYSVRARAVSDTGDLVTGELLIGKRGDASIRLMPVGFGYRYAVQGLWLDGWRGNSELHFGKPSTDRLRFTPG